MKQLHIASLTIGKESFALKTLQVLAELQRPAIATKKGEDTSIFPNFITMNFGEEILAVLDINNLHNSMHERTAPYSEKKLFWETRAKAEANLFNRGFIFDGKEFEFLTATPSQKKQGKATFCIKGFRKEILDAIGISEDDLDGQSFIKTEDKILPNMMSGQHEGSIAAAKLGMKNIFIIASRDEGTLYRHEIKNQKVQHLNVAGLMQGKVEKTSVFNKTGDANGIVIREMLPEFKRGFKAITGEEATLENIRKAFAEGKLTAINSAIHKMALRGELDLYWVEQSRGKGLKATLTDAPVVTWMLENDISALDGFFGEVKTIDELFAENKAILVSEDCLKASALWNTPEKWTRWTEKGYERILCCDNGHVSCVKGAEKNRVNTSRQHLCPIIGASDKAVEGFTAETIARMNAIVEEGNDTTKLLCKLFGAEEKNADTCKAFDTASLIPMRNEAESGKVSVPGTWAMAIWDLKPIIAVAAHLDNEADRQGLIAKMRTLAGQTAQLSNKAEEKVGALGRYPSLNKNLMMSRIVKGTDICDNAIMLSWDIAANDVMKADTDGDHLVVYFAESDEEREMATIAIRNAERS